MEQEPTCEYNAFKTNKNDDEGKNLTYVQMAQQKEWKKNYGYNICRLTYIRARSCELYYEILLTKKIFLFIRIT